MGPLLFVGPVIAFAAGFLVEKTVGDKVVTKGNYLLMEQAKGGEGQ